MHQTGVVAPEVLVNARKRIAAVPEPFAQSALHRAHGLFEWVTAPDLADDRQHIDVIADNTGLGDGFTGGNRGAEQELRPTCAPPDLKRQQGQDHGV